MCLTTSPPRWGVCRHANKLFTPQLPAIQTWSHINTDTVDSLFLSGFTPTWWSGPTPGLSILSLSFADITFSQLPSCSPLSLQHLTLPPSSSSLCIDPPTVDHLHTLIAVWPRLALNKPFLLIERHSAGAGLEAALSGPLLHTNKHTHTNTSETGGLLTFLDVVGQEGIAWSWNTERNEKCD